MAKVFSGVRTNVAAALAAAVGGVALTACNTGGYDSRPAPAYSQPQHSCGGTPTYTQPTYTQPTYPQPAPAPAPRPPQKSCGARCG